MKNEYPRKGELSAFEKDSLYRLCVETARLWVIGNYLSTGKLPETVSYWVYPSGPEACLDWGNAPGQDDPELKPLRYKRIKVTLEIEDSK